VAGARLANGPLLAAAESQEVEAVPQRAQAQAADGEEQDRVVPAVEQALAEEQARVAEAAPLRLPSPKKK
jgi:hypothetical protein